LCERTRPGLGIIEPRISDLSYRAW
jgi:hypothetical protein